MSELHSFMKKIYHKIPLSEKYKSILKKYYSKNVILRNNADSAFIYISVGNDRLAIDFKQLAHLSKVNFYSESELNFESQKRILVFSHELSRTGAPVVLLDTVKEMIREKHFVVVVSPCDGPLRDEFLQSGAIVIIDRKVMCGRGEEFSKSFFKTEWYMDTFVQEVDLILICTLVGHNLVNRYSQTNKPILWWLHEGKYSLDFYKNYLPKSIPNNVKVFCGGKYTQRLLKEFGFEYKSDLLLYGVNDVNKKVNKFIQQNNKVKFLLAGTIDERKGQDIVLEAIQKLEKEHLAKAEFFFVGDRNYGDTSNVYRQLFKMEKEYRNITVINAINREKLFEIYTKVDCLICPSRDDPMPVVATEMMMFSKVCICSTNTGTSDFIKDGYNGFIFENENAEELARKIAYVILHKNELNMIKKYSREVYEEIFAMDIFSNKLKNIIEQMTKKEENNEVVM